MCPPGGHLTYRTVPARGARRATWGARRGARDVGPAGARRRARPARPSGGGGLRIAFEPDAVPTALLGLAERRVGIGCVPFGLRHPGPHAARNSPAGTGRPYR